jgi:hypothetical protein
VGFWLVPDPRAAPLFHPIAKTTYFTVLLIDVPRLLLLLASYVLLFLLGVSPVLLLASYVRLFLLGVSPVLLLLVLPILLLLFVVSTVLLLLLLVSSSFSWSFLPLLLRRRLRLLIVASPSLASLAFAGVASSGLQVIVAVTMWAVDAVGVWYR